MCQHQPIFTQHTGLSDQIKNGFKEAMKIKCLKEFKSIKSLPEINLNSGFVVLTGVNGAGKSHLLQAIENGLIQLDDITQDNNSRPIRRFDWTNLVPQVTGAFAPSQITQEKHGLWNELNQYSKEYRLHISQIFEQFNCSELNSLKIREIINLTPENLIERGIEFEQSQQITQAIQSTVLAANQNTSARFVQNDQNNRQRLVNQLQNNISIPIIAFEEDDFYEHFPRSWQPVDVFQQSFGRLFADYQSNWRTNKLKQIANSEGRSVRYLTPEEFLEKHREPPWEFVNTVLETANLDFRINNPDEFEDRPYEPILTDQVTKVEIKFNDLSSGEKILMSFALCLYYAKDSRQLIDYPKVLLFDEIDVPLHPSMTQSLLNTIQEVLVKQHRIKVILTTHSPSTVALAPEYSIYAMYKAQQPRLQKSSKDKALSLLTAGVPTLSIEYENRRQVFVEHEKDVKYYEPIYDKLRNRLIPEVSLTFLAS